jgi:hypothetical protein
MVKGRILLTDFDACQRVFALIRCVSLALAFANHKISWSLERRHTHLCEARSHFAYEKPGETSRNQQKPGETRCGHPENKPKPLKTEKSKGI